MSWTRLDQWVTQLCDLLGTSENENPLQRVPPGLPYSQVTEALPFRIRDDFLSPAEKTFYDVLCQAVSGRAIICPKVRLSDVFFIVERFQHLGLANKLDRKHIDFLLCSIDTVRPIVAIELDDRSHLRADRRERDAFVDQVFVAAGLSLVRIPCSRCYDISVLSERITPFLSVPPVSTTIPFATEESAQIPICPKCGIPMVARKASRGKRAGSGFFGCRNFPQCRELIAEWS